MGSVLSELGLLLLLWAFPSFAKTWYDGFDATPDPSAVTTLEGARFTVLTPMLIRMEYHPSSVWSDEGTVSFLHRRLPVPSFTVERPTPRTLEIRTAALLLRYDAGAEGSPEPFISGLSVELLTYPFTTWTPSTVATRNLHGTIRTLDRVGEAVDLTCVTPRDVMTYYAHCEEGLVSRDGWVLVDDSVRPRLHPRADPPEGPWDVPRRHPDGEWPWVGGPSEENIAQLQAGRRVVSVDWYMFGHGLNYTQALKDFVAVSGRIPLLPRYALGPGFSRWYAWNEHEEIAHIVSDGFAAHGVPLDQLSIDMDWHPSYPRGLQNKFGTQVEGWTGYSVYPYLFPAMGAFYAHMKRRGVFINLNMHPASGVEFHEAAYPAAAAAMGLNPDLGQTIAFDFANQSYARSLFEHVLRPLDDAGLDYWWIDYQHGPFSTVPLLNPTFLTNFAWWTNPWRYGEKWSGLAKNAEAPPPDFGPAHVRNELLPGKRKHNDRPYIFGRWGGLGGHRYPVGFAGDTAVKWRVLRYETYFSPTSSNVGFMWTHDIGGFEGSPPPELLTRWVQWGCFSALLRTHSSKLSPGRSLWSYPNPYLSVMRNFYRLRARLMPYIATAQRVSHDEGLQILRPMYYTHPLAEAAYQDQGLHQYWWGDDVWVAPIAAPMAKDNASSATGIALRAQKEMQALNPGMMMMGGAMPGEKLEKLRPGKNGVPMANATLHQRNGLTAWTVWVPPGSWIEWFSWGWVRGEEKKGGGGDGQRAPPAAYDTGPGSFIVRNYSLGEMPVFSRPGTIIPMRTLPDANSASVPYGGEGPHTVDGAAAGDGTLGAPPPAGGTSLLGLAGAPYTDLTFWVLPLAPDSGLSAKRPVTTRARLYEDDGLSKAAEESGVYGWSDVTCTWARKKGEKGGGVLGGLLGGGGGAVDSLTCTLSAPALGPGAATLSDAGIPSKRALLWRVIGSFPPATVAVDGVPVARDTPAAPDAMGDHGGWLPSANAWAYSGPTLSTWVRVGAPVASGEAHTVELTWEEGLPADSPLLTSGYSRTLARSLVCKDEVDRGYSLVFPSDVEDVLNVSATATALSAARSGGAAREALAAVPAALRAGMEKVGAVTAMYGTTPSGFVMQQRCLGALADAAEGYPPPPAAADDPRVVIASAPQKYGSTIEHQRGSAPGQITQYSSTPGQDEFTSEEGLGDYYPQHAYLRTTNLPEVDMRAEGAGLPPGAPVVPAPRGAAAPRRAAVDATGAAAVIDEDEFSL